MTHQKVCGAVEYLRKSYGIPICIFFFMTAISGISMFYQILMHFRESSQGLQYSRPNSTASDLWTFINTISLMSTSFRAFGLADEGNRTLELVHKLINIYPDIEEFVKNL